MNSGLSIKDCLIILLATILITSAIMLIVTPLHLDKGLSDFVGYTVGMGLSAAFAIRTYRRKADTFKIEINTQYLKYTPLLALWPVLLVFGITSHLIHLIPMPDFVVELWKSSMGGFSIPALLATIVMAPILEELIFRGVMLKGMLEKYSPTKAILFSSLFFGIVHLNPWQFIGAFGIGILNGWIYWKTNNLLLPIIMHVSNNLVFSIVGMYFGASYLLETPVHQVLGSQFNQLLGIGLSIFLFGVIGYFLFRTISANELKDTSQNIA